jgi:hypothetical protein
MATMNKSFASLQADEHGQGGCVMKRSDDHIIEVTVPALDNLAARGADCSANLNLQSVRA